MTGNPLIRLRRRLLVALAALLLVCAANGQAPAAAAAVENAPAEEALAYLGQGETAYAMGDFAAAIDHLSNAIGICRVAGLEDLEVAARARRGRPLRGSAIWSGPSRISAGRWRRRMMAPSPHGWPRSPARWGMSA